MHAASARLDPAPDTSRRSLRIEDDVLRSFWATGVAMALVPLLSSVQEGLVASRAERQVVAAEQDWALAKRHGNRQRFAQLLAPDFIEINRFGRLVGRQNAIALSRTPLYETVDVAMRIYGGVAVVTGRESDEGSPPGGVRFLRVWIEDQRRWVALADQGTIIASEPSALRAEHSMPSYVDRTLIDQSGTDANHIADILEASTISASEVRDAERAYRDAERLGDSVQLERLRVPEFRLIDRLGNVLPPTSVQPPFKAVVDDDFGVRVHGNLGLVIGDVLRASLSNDATDRFRYSSVWIRERGQWHIVAEQRTPIS
jgi:hypothetical protein